jgi:hypothetical protein
MKVSGKLHALVALPPRERAPGAHWIGGWVGLKAGLDAVMKKFLASIGIRILDHPARSPAPYHWANPAPGEPKSESFKLELQEK